MQSKTRRYIEDGREYDNLFPEAKLKDSTVKRGADLSDTMQFIPQAVAYTTEQTKKLAKILKGDSVYSTCRNIWDFVYHHIQYHKDEDGREQIRSPSRTWHDRKRGVDCDCYTVFISTILTNLRIPHTLRITKYGKDYFQHIYPIVPLKGGSYIIVDCVVDSFNYEQPYSEKKDTPMELQFLEGIEDDYTTDGLGKKGWLKKLTHNIGHNLLHKLNRFNPATVALRNGILASMKLNLFKVGQRLKYAYMSEDQAKARGMNMDKWKQLVKAKDKIEDIFNKAGGIPNNLKKAILTGHGNKNHEVSGLGYVPEAGIEQMNVHTPLRKLLGKEMFESENVMNGTGALGDPVTGASVGVASVVMGLIAKLLKSIGNPFDKKKEDKGSSDFDTTSQDDAAASAAADGATSSDKALVANAGQTPVTSSDSGTDVVPGGDNGDTPPTFWQKNKKWLLPTGIVSAAGGALFGIIKLMQADNKKAEAKEKKKETVEGVRHKRKKIKVLQLR